MITSVQNSLVKQMRKLHQAKGRREQNLFLLEGTNLLEAACEVDCEMEAVCYTLAWQERYPQLWQKACQRAHRVEVVSPEVLGAIATTGNPDGVVATAVRNNRELATKANLKLGLVLERLQDPGNLGTIIRTAVATGVDGLWLSQDSVDLEQPKVLRSSAGEWFRMPMAVSEDLEVLVRDFQARGVQIVATLPLASKTYWQVDFTRPTLLLLGNEGAGLSDELSSLASERVKIPLVGGVESLNVGICAALLLYEAQRQVIGNR